MGIFSSCQHLCLRSSVKKQREVTGDTDDCKNCLGFFFLQVVKSLLDLKDEQLAVQMEAQDSLWGETGAFLLSIR